MSEYLKSQLPYDETIQRPIIGLLNIMPTAAAVKTEHNWRIALGDGVQLVPVRFDDDVRMRDSEAIWLDTYQPFSSVELDLDGIVITGANAEIHPDGSLLPYDAVRNIHALREVINWAESQSRLAIYSCLSSHIALDHIFGLPRSLQTQKLSGVFCHDVIIDDDLTDGLEMPFTSPHSRWGTIHPHELEGDADVEILIEGYEPGWLVAKRSRTSGVSVFLQGHPEYGHYDLHQEYQRDKETGARSPIGYYPNNDPNQSPDFRWEKDSLKLFANIIRLLKQQIKA